MSERKKRNTSRANIFSYHKKTGYVALWGVLCFVILLETIAIHLFLWNWNRAFGITMTVISIYTIIFFIADFASIIKRPVVFYENNLYLRIGIRWNVIIDPKQIQSIEIIRNFKKEKGILDCGLFGNPNILMVLYQPIIVRGLYGLKRNTNRIAFNIDNEKDFVKELKHYR